MNQPSPAEVTIFLTIIFFLLIIAVVLMARIPTDPDPPERTEPCPPTDPPEE